MDYPCTIHGSSTDPPAPACQGHEGCGHRTPCAFQQPWSWMCCSTSALRCFQEPKMVRVPPPSHGFLIRICYKNINCQTCFQGSRNQHSWSQSLAKNRHFAPERFENNFCGNLLVAVLSMRKTGFETPWRPYLNTSIVEKMSWK